MLVMKGFFFVHKKITPNLGVIFLCIKNVIYLVSVFYQYPTAVFGLSIVFVVFIP